MKELFTPKSEMNEMIQKKRYKKFEDMNYSELEEEFIELIEMKSQKVSELFVKHWNTDHDWFKLKYIADQLSYVSLPFIYMFERLQELEETVEVIDLKERVGKQLLSEKNPRYGWSHDVHKL